MAWTTREKVLAAGLIITIVVSAAVIALVWTHIISSKGRIKSIGCKFFWDPELTVEVIEIDWGLCNPGTSYRVTLFCQNIKNTQITLSMSTENWNPSIASFYITGIWNYTGKIIYPGASIPISIGIDISPDIAEVDTFSFDYLITATEVLPSGS